MPRVSVVVPVFRAERYIDQCLGSLAAQTFSDIEILCVDDCGNDGTISIAERYAEKDARFRILRHEKNSGQGCARNTGLKNVRAEYVVFIDNDDWAEAALVEKLYERMRAGGVDSVAAKQMMYKDSTGETKPVPSGVHAGVIDVPLEKDIFPACTACAKIFRRENLLKNGIFFPENMRHEDMEFFFNFHALFPKMEVLDYYGYCYRIHPDSTTGGFGDGRCRPDHVAEMMCRSLLFLQERGCFERNRQFLLDFYAANMDAFLIVSPYKQNTIVLLQDCLRRIGYPEEFVGCRRYDLDAVLACKNNPALYKWYKPLMLLNRINPFSRHRRKIRTWLRINCLSLQKWSRW